ncbi:MAG: GNAT family N-acetyltransferase [Clostridia bacterium]|nr:GNAT family N-acetyltransferase [Clostridia bacterium]
MDIRVAREEDIDGILNLLLQVNQVHADGRPDLFKSGGTKYNHENLAIKLQEPNERIFVAVEDGQVLGYSFVVMEEDPETINTYAHRTLYIDDLCVDEVQRGKHIGTSLFAEVKKYASSIDAYRVTLRVWECNPTARKFYDSLDMKPLYTEMEYIL